MRFHGRVFFARFGWLTLRKCAAFRLRTALFAAPLPQRNGLTWPRALARRTRYVRPASKRIIVRIAVPLVLSAIGDELSGFRSVEPLNNVQRHIDAGRNA
jgi:hypothetical protein